MYPKCAGGSAARASASKSATFSTWSALVMGAGSRRNRRDGGSASSACVCDKICGSRVTPPIKLRRVSGIDRTPLGVRSALFFYVFSLRERGIVIEIASAHPMQLRRGARSFRYLIVPALESRVLLGHGEVDRLGGKINRHHRGDVSDRVALTGDKRHMLKPRIEIGEEVLHPLFAALGQRRDLIVVVGTGDRAPLESRRGIADRFHHRCESLLLYASFPHRRQRPFLGCLTVERCLWMDFLQVAQDGGYFTDRRAILDHQGGYDATWIDRAIRLGMLLALAEINGNQRNFEALLREEDAHAPRIG